MLGTVSNGSSRAISKPTYLAENHGGNLLGGEGLISAVNLNLDNRLLILGDNLVGEVLDIALDVLLRELAADQTLDVVDGLERVRCGLVLGGVSDESLILGEGDIRGGDTVSWGRLSAVGSEAEDAHNPQRTLIVDQNLDLALLHHTHTPNSC